MAGDPSVGVYSEGVRTDRTMYVPVRSGPGWPLRGSAAAGCFDLRVSFQRGLEEGVTDPMPLQKYDVQDHVASAPARASATGPGEFARLPRGESRDHAPDPPRPERHGTGARARAHRSTFASIESSWSLSARWRSGCSSAGGRALR